MKQPSLDEILSRPATELLKWLRAKDRVAEGVNLDGLASGAQGFALCEGPMAVSDRLVYAQVALEAWLQLREEHEGTPAFYDSLPSEILLRSELLRRFDVGSEVIFGKAEFFRVLEQSIAALENKGEREWIASPDLLPNTDKSTLLNLRKIKNLMRSARLFLEGDITHLGPVSAWWWHRRELLP